MSTVSQQYLKDKNGNIFSPIVSSQSVKLLRGGELTNVMIIDPTVDPHKDEWICFSSLNRNSLGNCKSAFVLTEGDLASSSYGIYILQVNARDGIKCSLKELVPHLKIQFNFSSYINVGYAIEGDIVKFYLHRGLGNNDSNYMYIQMLCLARAAGDPGTAIHTQTEPTGITYFDWKISTGNGLQNYVD